MPAVDGRVRTSPKRRAIGASSLTVADVASKAVTFLITPYLANRLGAAEFGILNLYLAVAQILSFIIAFGGAGLLAAEYVRRGYTAARQMRSVNLRLSAYASATLAVIGLAVSGLVPDAVPPTAALALVALSYVQALNVLELAYYRGAQSYKVAIIGQLGSTLLNGALTVAAFELHSAGAVTRLLCVAVALAAAQLLYLVELRAKAYDRADEDDRRRQRTVVLRFWSSIFLHQASHWVRSTIDRFVVSAYFGLAATGVYSVAWIVATIVSIFFTSINQALQPYFYGALKEHNLVQLRRLRLSYLAAVAFVSLASYLAFLWTFDWFFKPEFDGAKAVIAPLMVGTAALSTYLVFTHPAFYERKGGQISTVTTCSLLVHLAGLVLLGAVGRITPFSVATLFAVSSIFAMCGMALLSRRTIRHLMSIPSEDHHA